MRASVTLMMSIWACLTLAACNGGPLADAPVPPEPRFAMAGPGPGPTGGALVGNSGAGHPESEEVVCFFDVFTSTRGTSVRSPSGNATLSCHFEDLPPIAHSVVLKNWPCIIVHGGTSQTSNTQWVRQTSGVAEMTCQFSDKPVFNAAVTYDDVAVSAEEGTITTPLADLPSQSVSGVLVDVGRGCNGDPLSNDPAGRIALLERGACAFTEKLTNVLAEGAIGAIVYNSVAGGDDIITMGGAGVVPIPGVFVGRSAGLGLKAVAPTAATILWCARSATCRGSL